jgi:hypothetical protein
MVYAKGHNDGKGKACNKTVEIYKQSVPQDIEKIRRSKESLKIIKTRPSTTPYSQARRKIFKGHKYAINRDIIKDKNINKGNAYEEIKTTGIPSLTPDTGLTREE